MNKLKITGLFLTFAVVAAFAVAQPARAVIKQWSMYDTDGTAYDVAWANDYLYIADGAAGLKVMNASAPNNLTLMGSYNTPGTAKSVAVVGDSNVVVADGSSGLAIINVGSGSNPNLITTYAPAGVSFNTVESVGTMVYALSTTDLYIIDLSTTATPVLKSTLTLDNPRSLAVSGNYAYVTLSNGIKIVYISTPTAPTVVGTLDGTATGFGPYGIYLNNGYAYAADWTMGFVVADVRTVTSPTIVIDTASEPNGSDFGITGFGHYVLTNGSMGIAGTTNKLYLYDVTVPAAPILVETFQAADVPHAMTYALGVVYVAEQDAGVRALNLSEADLPVISKPTIKERNSISIKVSGKSKTITPFGKTFTELYSRKVNFGLLRGSVYFFASNGQRKKTPLKVYGSDGKLIKAYDPFSNFNGAGLNVDLGIATDTAHDNRVYVAVGAKQNGQTVRFYQLTTTGLTSMERFKIGTSKKKGNIALKFANPSGTQLQLIAVVQGHPKSTLTVFKLDPVLNVWVKDTTFDKKRITVVGSKITVK